MDISAARREIRSRLITALVEEKLITCPIPPDDDPVVVLQKVRPYMTMPVTNFDRTAAELADSVLGLARARDSVRRRYAHRSELGNMEQLVCEGHPKHPCAKTSLGLGAAFDQVLPEQVETITLRFVAVRAGLVQTSGMPLIDALRSQIPGLAAKLSAECPPGFLVVPVHPWQLEHVIELSDDVQLLTTTAVAEPLMSVRTLRVSDATGSVHIKTSVDFQLTGAIRGISAAAVAGPTIAERAQKLLRMTAVAPYTRENTPAFQIAQDLAGVRVNSSLGAIVRVEPRGIPVAALLATNPLTGQNFFREFLAESGATPAEWFQRLATILIQPALELLSYGLAMEPHPQNTVLELRDGWPYSVTVRDFGGCRIVRGSQFYLQHDWEFLEGTALLTDSFNAARDKLLYPMITNLVLELCAAAEIDPATVIIDGLPAELPRKRMFAMRLSGAVTEQDYVRIPNPLGQVQPIDETSWAEQHVQQRIAETMAVEGITTPPDPADVANAVDTLALVKQTVDRRLALYRSPAELIDTMPPELRGVMADSLAVTGHNVHPLAKLRRGFSTEESALYGPENFRPTYLKIIGVQPDLLAETGDITGILRAEFPAHIPDTSLRIVPVHPWQWEHVIQSEFADELAAGQVVDLSTTLPVLPTLSLRTALTYHPGTSGRRLYIKTSVDATLTSTRRSMSQDSALGTPNVAAALAPLVSCDVLKEIAGCAYQGPKTTQAAIRGLSTLIREATPRPVLTAATLRNLPAVTEEFLPKYARDLLEAVLPMMWHHGVALEVHLQNTLLYVDKNLSYQGLCLRDFSGIRIYSPRATINPARPGAITVTDDYDTFIRKGYYAAFPGNLAEIVAILTAKTGKNPQTYWRIIRAIVDELIAQHQPPQEDVAALLAPTMKQKAFLRMAQNPDAGDAYVDIPNPLVGYT